MGPLKHTCSVETEPRKVLERYTEHRLLEEDVVDDMLGRIAVAVPLMVWLGVSQRLQNPPTLYHPSFRLKSLISRGAPSQASHSFRLVLVYEPSVLPTILSSNDSAFRS